MNEFHFSSQREYSIRGANESKSAKLNDFCIMSTPKAKSQHDFFHTIQNEDVHHRFIFFHLWVLLTPLVTQICMGEERNFEKEINSVKILETNLGGDGTASSY